MMDRRQFASRTASTLLALQARGLFGAPGEPAPSRPGEFRLKDFLGVYDFPEELLSYPVTFGSPVPRQDLRLVQRGKREAIPFQLTEVEESNGHVAKAVVHFRANLRMGEEKNFTFAADDKLSPSGAQPLALEKMDGGRLAIHANLLQVMVPESGDRALHLPVSQAPAPLLALARTPGQWVGRGVLEGPADLIVQGMNARVVEQGPLFVKYAITYTFSNNREYSVELKVQRNESHVEVSEVTTGLGPDDHLAFRFSYKDGVDPNGRLLMANGGYSTGGSQQGASGAYDQGVNAGGLLPIKLGLYTPNSINLPRSIAFWNDSGPNAMLFTLFRLPEWKTSTRALWNASSLPDNLEFHAEPNGGDKFMRAAIVGRERHWAVALISRADMVVRGYSMGDLATPTPRTPARSWTVVSSMQGLVTYGGGPDTRLLMKLNDYSLNRYKDLIFEFPEEATPAFTLPNSSPETMTGPDYLKMWRRNYAFPGQVGWDYSGDLGPNHWGWSTEPQSVNYAFNAAKWSPQDRLQARSWLVFAAYMLELDTAMPQTSMLGGHPNFAAEFKQILGIAPGLFPKHPHAPRWRDTYLRFFDEYCDKYIRKADETTGARSGRFVESIACYNYASMEATTLAASGLKQFDGTQIFNRPEVRAWAHWDMASRLPFRVDGVRIVPPQGAHAAVALLSPGGRWYKVAYAMARLVRETAPQVGDEWLWSLTGGAEGKKPVLRSAVFVDYGPVFRYDFGGPDEAYLQLQQLNGANYRWGGASNGALYYAAKGKVWSWNQSETNGDGFDITKLPVFQAGNSALGAAPADSVLYDFGFAQYYRALGAPPRGPSAYSARSVIMVRGDYLAVFDQVQGGASGNFNWANLSSGLRLEIFNDATFTQRIRTITDDNRWPGKLDADDVRDFKLPTGAFSTRSTGQLLVPVAGKYTFRTNWRPVDKDIPSGDSVRLLLDDHKVLDTHGPGSATIELEARAYQVLYECVHTAKTPPAFRLSWVRPDKPGFETIDNGYFRNSAPMPFIAEIKSSSGNQVHIVAPGNLDVASLPTGGASIGKQEFVMFSGDAKDLKQDGLTFAGRAGYARAGELALFEGTHLEWNGLGLSREEGDFGASIRQASPKTLEGRVAGRAGGTLHVHLPAGFAASGVKATFDGKAMAVKAQDSTLSFAVAIAQADGYKEFSIVAE